MPANDSPTVAARRLRLQEWIDANYEGKQALFIAATGINQGELSGLLRSKSFGEKKAEALEQQAKMPSGYLVYPFGLNRLTDEQAPYHAALTPSHSVELDEATVTHALRAMQRICTRRGWSHTIESLIEHAGSFVDALSFYAGTADESDPGATVLESISNQGDEDGRRMRRESGGKASGKAGGNREAAAIQATASAGRGGKRKK